MTDTDDLRLAEEPFRIVRLFRNLQIERDRLSEAIGLVDAFLDEKAVQTQSGGIGLSTAGRVRALWSNLVISGNQRACDLEEEGTANLRDFALWMSPIWEPDNEDDVAAATAAVEAFLEERAR